VVFKLLFFFKEKKVSIVCFPGFFFSLVCGGRLSIARARNKSHVGAIGWWYKEGGGRGGGGGGEGGKYSLYCGQGFGFLKIGGFLTRVCLQGRE
jgi:hypothetical protein